MGIKFQSRRTIVGAVRQADETSVGTDFQNRRTAYGAMRQAGTASVGIKFQSRRTADGAVRQAGRTSVGIKFQCLRTADGAVRQAGKALGMTEAAREEIYFRKLQSHQISRMREQLGDVVDYHQRTIQELPEAIERHKKIQKLHHQEKDMTGSLD